MDERRSFTADTLGVSFNELPPPEEVVVRRHGEVLGRLIRSSSGGPVWADAALQRHIGGPLTVDGPMRSARSKVLTRLLEQEV